jgi:3',5'-cyclic AMP phosphodiesterase CpdA
MCPYADPTQVETNYLTGFLTFLEKAKITADYLVIPGDITDRAHPDEFTLSTDILTHIAKQVGVPHERIILVPGNHDVDWNQLAHKDESGFYKTLRYAPLSETSWLPGQVLARARGSLVEAPFIASWTADKVLFIGYNSSWHDDPKVSVHHGAIHPEHLSALETELASLVADEHKLRVFVVHHHPVQYSDPIADFDFSTMQNSENLLTLLRRYRFDVLIHGHRHCPRVRTITENNGHPLVVLCSGSFSVSLDTRYSGIISNQFHVVDIEGTDGPTATVYGTIRSWAYVYGRGWSESQVHNGIRSPENFGSALQPSHVRNTLGPIIKALLQSPGYALWNDIVKADPLLARVHTDAVFDAVTSLQDSIGFRVMGNRLADLVLLPLPQEGTR